MGNSGLWSSSMLAAALGLNGNVSANVGAYSPLVSAQNAADLAAYSPISTVQDYQSDISVLGSLQSQLDNVQTAAQALLAPDTLVGNDVSSSNSTVATATADSSATAGSYDLSVTGLAQGQVLSTSSVSDANAAIGSGTLSFQIGNGSAQNVQIGSDNSLQGISDAINAAGIGISAAVTGNNGNYSLTLTGPTG